MRRFFLAAGLAAPMFVVTACGGGYGTSSPSGPSDTPPPAGAIAINVVRENGNQSFSPNPATIPTGQTAVWHNIDTTTHRVVLNGGKLDTGNLAPGAFSQPMTLGCDRPLSLLDSPIHGGDRDGHGIRWHPTCRRILSPAPARGIL